MTILYIALIHDSLWFTFLGKKTCFASFRSNQDDYFNFSQLHIRSKLSLVPHFLLLCISNPGFGRRLWEKAVGKILCHSSRGSVVPGLWLVSWRFFWAMTLHTHLAHVLPSALPDVFIVLLVGAAITGSVLTLSKEYCLFHRKAI